MNCHDHIDALVDVARGLATGTDVERAALEHARRCAVCEDRLAFERTLTDSLRELAAVIPEPNVNALEQRLLSAFVRQHDASKVGRVRNPQSPWWRWAAAAVLVLSAAVTWYPVEPTRIVPSDVSNETPQDAASPPTASREAVKPPPRVPVVSTPARPRRQARQMQSAVEATPQFADFLALPGASALPDFESGRIVRVQVPLTVLPAYGMDLVLDATPTSVEADFLVGQDGLPRAIRLASSIFRSRR